MIKIVLFIIINIIKINYKIIYFLTHKKNYIIIFYNMFKFRDNIYCNFIIIRNYLILLLFNKYINIINNKLNNIHLLQLMKNLP